MASDATHGYVGALESGRAGFQTSADLLRVTPRDARLLDAQDVQAHRQWGEEMLDVARLAIRNDWVLLDRPAPVEAAAPEPVVAVVHRVDQ